MAADKTETITKVVAGPKETVDVFVVHHIADIPNDKGLYSRLTSRMREAGDNIIHRLQAGAPKRRASIHDKKEDLDDAVDDIKQAVKQQVFEVEHSLEDLLEDVEEGFDRATRSAMSIGHEATRDARHVTRSVKNAAAAATEGAKDIAEGFYENADKIFRGSKRRASHFERGAERFAHDLSEDAKDKAQELGDDVEDSVHDMKRRGSKIWRDAQGRVRKGSHDAHQYAHDVKEGVKRSARDKFEDARGFGDAIRHDIHERARAAHDRADAYKQEAWRQSGQAQSYIGSIQDYITNWFSEAKQKARENLENRREGEAQPFFIASEADQKRLTSENVKALHGEGEFARVASPQYQADGSISHDFSNLDAKIQGDLQRARKYWSGRKHEIASSVRSKFGLSPSERHWMSLSGPHTLGEAYNDPHAPLTGFYGALMLLYALVLGYRLWQQRTKTNIYVGDGTIQAGQAQAQTLITKSTSRAETTKGSKKTDRTAEITEVPSLPAQSEYSELTRLNDAFSSFAITAPLSILLTGLLELNHFAPSLIHYMYLTLILSVLLTFEFGLLSKDESSIAEPQLYSVLGYCSWNDLCTRFLVLAMSQQSRNPSEGTLQWPELVKAQVKAYVERIPLVTAVTSTTVLLICFLSEITQTSLDAFTLDAQAVLTKLQVWRLATWPFLSYNLLDAVINSLIFLLVCAAVERSMGSLPLLGYLLQVATLLPALLFLVFSQFVRMVSGGWGHVPMYGLNYWILSIIAFNVSKAFKAGGQELESLMASFRQPWLITLWALFIINLLFTPVMIPSYALVILCAYLDAFGYLSRIRPSVDSFARLEEIPVGARLAQQPRFVTIDAATGSFLPLFNAQNATMPGGWTFVASSDTSFVNTSDTPNPTPTSDSFPGTPRRLNS
ncbi:hypothetical protein BZG36_01574 [Bifiguratus adelaidae]|uniref:Uncharacterized protein n=1 Tax=Bifiguratus adelaidae TaxID=1938954 RepID=A0A261Y419_9FUNG|nr:hypothetical protein BZG36_01574 [Bifiguratus adelaidae]